MLSRRLSAALFVLLALFGVQEIKAQSAAPAMTLEGIWASDWGNVTFENVQQQSDGTYRFFVSWLGTFESGRSEPTGGNNYMPGLYNPKTGQVSFRYLQTSFNGVDRGTASFTTSIDGTTARLTGTYRHDSGRTNAWEMARELSVCPAVQAALQDPEFIKKFNAFVTELQIGDKVMELAVNASLKRYGTACPVDGSILNADDAGAQGNGPLTDEEKQAVLDKAAKGTGDFGLGSATEEEANELGKQWVGQNYTISPRGYYVSEDGLRQYRPPTFKVGQGLRQANFESRASRAGKNNWPNNGHLNIR